MIKLLLLQARAAATSHRHATYRLTGRHSGQARIGPLVMLGADKVNAFRT